MFSNHILKPERTPLESSVWGGNRCSGTFATLFESRLIPAKRYLDVPFELGTEPQLFEGDSGGKPAKVLASNPIRPTMIDCWAGASRSSTALILNGDSARLPIPDKSIDAVITDPPYFDFIHYSELSDFFYAWLSPVLADEHPSFRPADSSAAGEVQHKEATSFAEALGNVLRESARVLKDEGVLAFSFHHSRSEGWGAIQAALTSAGLTVAASHPLHAELRAASPKSAAKDPISLDAILVCRKSTAVGPSAWSESYLLDKVRNSSASLIAGGMKLSKTDVFVMLAGELLTVAGGLSTDDFCKTLDRLRVEIERS